MTMIRELRENRHSLIMRVVNCIQSKQEGTTWDFKREWYENDKAPDLLHDIICMANHVNHEDSIIIIGVDEEKDYEICGVNNDPHRKRTQDIVCILRDKKFVGGIRPVVHVETIKLDDKLLDIIVIEDSSNTPFYLTENKQGLFANHIYTRVMDTNTPIDKSADINIVEALWRKRFGLDEPVIYRAFIYLQNPENWTSLDGDTTHFYKYSPEFLIENEPCEDERNGYEYYLFSQTDSRPRWYYIRLKYHQTVIYSTLGLALDGGRLFTSIPTVTSFRSEAEKEAIYFCSFTENTHNYAIHSFYYKLSPNYNDALYSRTGLFRCVPVFHSEEEKDAFLQYATKNFHRDREFIRPPLKPSFPVSLPTKEMVSVYKKQYHDAMIVEDMLASFRILM